MTARAGGPALSARIRSVVEGGDDGWEVYYRARAMKEDGREVIMLTVGDHDVPTASEIVDAMRRSAEGGNLGYAAVPGSDALRDAVAARAGARTGARATRANVMITPGGQAALFAAMTAALDPGDACVLIAPYYATFPLTVRAAAGRVAVVDAAADAGFQPDPEAVRAAIRRSGAKAVLMNSPNNPTGAVYRRDTVERLAAVSREEGAWLIADELYESQVHEGEHVSPRALPGMADGVMSVGSLSKSHAMTGWRIGWLLGPEEAIARVCELAIATTYGVPGFIQDAALHAIATGEPGEAAIAARYRRRGEAARAALADAPGVRAHPPQGGMYLMLDIRASGLSGGAFALALLEETGVAVMPGESFGAAGAGHLRIALTAPEPQLVEAMTRLARFAAARVSGAA